MLSFGRETTGDFEVSAQREWLVTNGIGGFAAGTVAGANTRRYHGLLVAALAPPVGRTLLVSALHARATYIATGRSFELASAEWGDGTIAPQGFRLLESFSLDGQIPCWLYALDDARLEQRIWMHHGYNTTYVTLTCLSGAGPLALEITPLCAFRDFHSHMRGQGWALGVAPAEGGGARVDAFSGAAPYWVRASRGEFHVAGSWYWNLKHRVETYRGLDDREDLYAIGTLRATLEPGETLTIVATTDEAASLDGAAALARERARQAAVLAQFGIGDAPDAVRQLLLAADQFIVARPTPDDPGGQSVIAGYHWFSDWGRDTMIALPGLTLATGRPDITARILRTFARYVDRGMLPNRFPDAGETPEYNTVDATLWYFEAVRAYVAATGDLDLARELAPVLADIVDWHVRGTRYNIHVDESDGLLAAGEPGVQLTWMDAKIGDWVVTPRNGKPVEINALWINALRIAADLAARLGQASRATAVGAMADRATESFLARYWHAGDGYLYDVIDGPDGDDSTLRPNQLLAVSLPYGPLAADVERARRVVEVCARHLVTSHGLRSLAPDHPAYVGAYGGDQLKRDSAYHQGTVWGWLIGPFVSAHLRVYRDPERARAFLTPLLGQVASHCIGTLSEIFDGNPPFTPRGCVAQAWTVAEALRVWTELR